MTDPVAPTGVLKTAEADVTVVESFWAKHEIAIIAVAAACVIAIVIGAIL